MRKEMIEKQNDLVVRAENIVNKAEAEKRELTDAEAQELAEIRDDVRKIKERLGLLKDIDGLEKAEAPKPAAKVEVEEDGDKEIELKETRAFEAYIRGKALELRDGEGAVSPLTKSNNGAVIPTTIAKRIIKKVYDISPILERSTKYNMKGTFKIPYYDETSSAVTVDYQDEFVAPDPNSGKFTSITMTDYAVSALTTLSWALKDNAEFDIVGYMVDIMALAFKRFTEKQLLGFGNTAKIAGLSGVTQTIEAAAANAIAADELIDLQDSVKDEFQDGAIWIMSPKTRTALRKLKDNMGRYLLQDDISAPFGKVLLGKPVYVSDNMPDMAAGKVAIYYGNMKGLATKFTKEMSIRILDQLYATQAADGIYGYADFDAKVQDAQQISALIMAGGAGSDGSK